VELGSEIAPLLVMLKYMLRIDRQCRTAVTGFRVLEAHHEGARLVRALEQQQVVRSHQEAATMGELKAVL
jgi:hypothetical protein